ncbi:hypothetical protein MKX01_011142 [Papaver californicum]|nr:hypothetical protein MKX01_011142 [Papaver californicum]
MNMAEDIEVSSLVRGVKGRKSRVKERFCDCAWRFVDESGKEILVMGSQVQDLVDHKFLEAEILQVYMCKLEQKQKEEGYKVLDSQEIEKYTPSAFMTPQSFEDDTRIQTHFNEFIASIPDGVQELIIPIFTSSCSHWTLLHFNFGDHHWKHYNSFMNRSTRDKCRGSAELMMSTCNIPIKERQENLRAMYPIIGPIEETPFSDCLLFVAYFMKLIMKRRDLPKERSNVTKKMERKRIKMAVKLVTDRKHSTVGDLLC